MKVAVVHHTLSSLGGGEKVFTYLVRALNDRGVVPDVYSSSPASPAELEAVYGVRVEFRLRNTIRLPRLPVFGIYQRLLMAYISSRIRGRYDVVVNTTGVFTPVYFRRRQVGRYILYVYNPQVSIFGPRPAWDVAVAEKYERSLFWRLYFKPYKYLMARSIRNIDDALLVSVSRFTAERVRKYWGKESIVVYPPVDVEKFSRAWDGPHREGVIVIGRYTPEKRYLELLDVARRLRGITFRFVGGAGTPYYRLYYERVRARAEELDLENVELYRDLPLDKLVELVAESKIHVHAMVHEDFGLVVAEAISGGLLPLPHNSGGPREIVPYRELRWSTFDELARKIAVWHSAPRSMVEHYTRRLRKHVERFRAENFMENMARLVLGGGN